MSQNKGQKKKTGFARKMVVWVLVALMVLGTIVPSLAWIFSINTNAAYSVNTDDTIVRIGLLYGDSVVPAFQTRSPYGFTVCTVDNETNEVTELYKLSSVKTIEATVEKNLSVTGGDYVPVSEGGDIGAYHAMLDMPLSLDELYLSMHTVVDNGGNAPMIASYQNGAYYLLIGSFTSYDSAMYYVDNEGDIFAGLDFGYETDFSMTVCEPSESAVNLIDYNTNMIVFRYDGGEYEQLGLMANDSDEGERAYLQTPANKLYDGVFIFTRYKNGVQLVNLIELEDYILGVLPYEISNSWPLETQKAFAVAVRSYTVNSLGKHIKTYGFEMCNTVCCQAYHGVRSVNDTVRQAVEETASQVLVSREGDIITTYYSAVAGGTTVSSAEAWGGSASSYLVAKPTPWEDYSNHPNGLWKWSVSPKELANILVLKGYNEIKGEIESVEAEYAENSAYVYKLHFTDVYGNTVTIKNTDTVRSKLSKYLKSSNFIVGKGSVTVNDPAYGDKNEKKLFSRLNGDKISYISWTDTMNVLTAEGETYTFAGVDTPVLTESGVEYVEREHVIKGDNGDHFVFAGRGWGHGVGLSQVGAYCLGLKGFDYETILTSYFADTHLEDYYDRMGIVRNDEDEYSEDDEWYEEDLYEFDEDNEEDDGWKDDDDGFTEEPADTADMPEWLL